MTIRCVLLAGRSSDAELTAIESMLRQIGVPCVRIDADRIEELDLHLDLDSGLLTVNGRSLDPTVIWVRHFPAYMSAGSSDRFAHDSWAALVQQLATSAGVRLPGAAPGQLTQLQDAARLGVRVPRTVVSTNRHALPPMWRRVVVKAVDLHYVEWPPGSFTWFLPEVLDPAEASPWQRQGIPAVFQEYVEHDAELRVYFVLGHICAFEVQKSSPSDIWLAPERVTVRPAEPSPAVIKATSVLAASWRMTFGAFDFLLTDGEPVFLEINADGDWRWFETKAGTALVTTTVARALADIHRGTLPVEAGEHLDLVTFLAG